MIDITNETPAVQICYQWLDAQKRTVNANGYVEKHRIERWAGFYIDKDAVIRALQLHGLKSDAYPRANISKRVIKPLLSRITHLPETRSMAYQIGEHDYANEEK
jgi:hypothetical protein